MRKRGLLPIPAIVFLLSGAHCPPRVTPELISACPAGTGYVQDTDVQDRCGGQVEADLKTTRGNLSGKCTFIDKTKIVCKFTDEPCKGSRVDYITRDKIQCAPISARDACIGGEADQCDVYASIMLREIGESARATAAAWKERGIAQSQYNVACHGQTVTFEAGQGCAVGLLRPTATQLTDCQVAYCQLAEAKTRTDEADRLAKSQH